MARVFRFLPSCAVLAALCGCSLLPVPPERRTVYHDIGFPKNVLELPRPVVVTRFDGDVGDRAKMCFRVAGNTIKPDAFNRWSQPPASLLRRYLTLALRGSGGDVPATDAKAGLIEIGGELIRFDGDLDSKTATLCVLVVASTPGRRLVERKTFFREVFTVTAPFDGKTASSFAEAMGEASSKLAKEIASRLGKAHGGG